jgi:glycolate oxidase FAD binding subunit
MPTMIQPVSASDIQAAVRASRRVVARGGGSKTGLACLGEADTVLDLTALSGVLEYEPAEFTFTARSGTRLSEVDALLAQHGQYLPFDPPLVERGATLGGTVAAGLSGPGRYRYGGVRDFILGVRLVDGTGEFVRGGGRVVKNAAGFDLPKLMVGSLGRLGVMVELAFKVFPRPEASVSLRLPCATLDVAVGALLRLYGAALDIDALELVPGDGNLALWVRLAGLRAALAARAERVRRMMGAGDLVDGAEESDWWRAARELDWVPDGWCLVKVPLAPRRIVDLEAALAGHAAQRRYSAGGNLAWIATSEPPAWLDAALQGLKLPGLVVLGPPGQPQIGARTGAIFGPRVKQALDPEGKFGAFA